MEKIKTVLPEDNGRISITESDYEKLLQDVKNMPYQLFQFGDKFFPSIDDIYENITGENMDDIAFLMWCLNAPARPEDKRARSVMRHTLYDSLEIIYKEGDDSGA